MLSMGCCTSKVTDQTLDQNGGISRDVKIVANAPMDLVSSQIKPKKPRITQE